MAQNPPPLTEHDTLSSLDLFYKSYEDRYDEAAISNVSSRTAGSLSVVSEWCPPGLEALQVSDTLYLKIYSGPKVLAQVTKRAVFEILNGEGERIYMITNTISSLKVDTPVEERKSKYGFNMIVRNHKGQNCFEYFGNTGQLVKAGAPGGERSWGIVSRHWKTAKCLCRCEGCTKSLEFDVVMYPHKDVVSEDPQKYYIKGTKKSSVFPSLETKKLYYGTFECDIAVKIPELPDDNVSEGQKNDKGKLPTESEKSLKIGMISSNMLCGPLGTELPGIIFPKKMNVHSKIVLFGALLVNVIKT